MSQGTLTYSQLDAIPKSMRDSDTIHLRSICALLESRQSREAANTAIYEVQDAASALDQGPATTGGSMGPCVVIAERAQKSSIQAERTL